MEDHHKIDTDRSQGENRSISGKYYSLSSKQVPRIRELEKIVLGR